MSSASLGTQTNSHGLPYGLYEPAGGTAPDIAGQGIAIPVHRFFRGNDARVFLRRNRDCSPDPRRG